MAESSAFPQVQTPVQVDVDARPPLSKGVVWLLCLLLTPLCGAVLYYAWRRSAPAAARHANRAAWVSLALWLGIGAAAYGTGLIGSGRVNITWQCKPRGERALECSFESESGSGEVCTDVVVTCGDQAHVAHACSGHLGEHESRTIEVAGFHPPLAPGVACSGVKFDNESMR